jgi:hypothetical protein
MKIEYHTKNTLNKQTFRARNSRPMIGLHWWAKTEGGFHVFYEKSSPSMVHRRVARVGIRFGVAIFGYTEAKNHR